MALNQLQQQLLERHRSESALQALLEQRIGIAAVAELREALDSASFGGALQDRRQPK